MPSVTTPPAVLRLKGWTSPWAWWRLPAAVRETEPRRIALTLDDGPSPYVREVLAVLAEEGVRATFFVLGDRCRAFPEVLRDIAAAAHGIGLHGDTHQEFTHRDSQPWERRLAENRRAIDEALGAGNAAVQPYFRPPFGRLKTDWAREIGREYRIVNCSLLPGSLDVWPRRANWREPAELVAQRVRAGLHPGAIIALHCGQRGDHGVYDMPHAAETVRSVCRLVRDLGYALDRLP